MNIPKIDNNKYIPKIIKQSPVKSIGYKSLSSEVVKSAGIDYSVVPKSVLRQKIIESRIQSLTPIQSKEEYKKSLSTILKYAVSSGDFVSGLISLMGYEKIDKELIGLVPYCGLADLSDQINSWLTGRSFKYQDMLPDEKMTNIVRTFEYSLNKLDKKYGKYEGKLYRTGHFNPNTDSQYYSASKDINCTISHRTFKQPSPSTPFSIIHVKRGHNICQFQEDANSYPSRRFAKEEQEILIDRKSKFKKIPPEKYTKEDIKDILDVASKTMNLQLKPENWENIDALKYISIWEEI